MMKLLRAALALLLLTSPLNAQGVGQLGAGQMWGNSTASARPAAPTTVTAIVDRALTGATTQGAVLTRNATVWVGLAPGTSGLPLLSGGAAANLAYGVLGLSAGGTSATSASAARTALGLGTAATQNTGTSGGNVPLLNGTNTWASAQTFTAAPVFTDQAASRTALGLGTMAVQNASAVAITGGTITGMANPSVGSDVANKTYVDSVGSGITILSPSALATAAVLPNTPTYANGASGVGATLTAGANAALVVDGVTVTASQRILVKNQASTFQNGIYTVTTVGDGSTAWVLTRATDFDTAAEMLKGSYTFVTAGNTNINSAYVLSATVSTVGTDPATFTLFSAASGVASLGGATGAITLGTGLSMVGSTLTKTASFLDGTVSTKATNYTVLDADNRSTIHLTGAQTTLTITAPSTYTDTTFAVGFCNLQASISNTISDNAVTQRVYPGQCGWVQRAAAGTVWVWAPQKGMPYRMSGAALFVSTTGSDNNDGLTSGTALATIPEAQSRLCTDINSQGSNATIWLAAGTYDGNFGRFGQCPNVADGMSIRGATSNPTLYRLRGSVAAGTTAQARDMGILFLTDLTVTCTAGTAAGTAVAASQFGVVDLTNVIINGCDNGKMIEAAEAGAINTSTLILDSNVLTDFFHSHGTGSKIVISGDVTCTGALNGTNFLHVLDNANITASGATFTGCGSVGATKWLAQYGGGLISAVVTIPGSGAGSTDAATFAWKR